MWTKFAEALADEEVAMVLVFTLCHPLIKMLLHLYLLEQQQNNTFPSIMLQKLGKITQTVECKKVTLPSPSTPKLVSSVLVS